MSKTKNKRKIILLILLVLLLGGCTAGTNKNITEKTAPKSVENNDPTDAMSRINELNNGIKAKTRTKKEEKKQTKQTKQNNMTNEIQQENLLTKYDAAVIKTNLGDIAVAFYTKDSPYTVNNFLNLAKKGFYNGTKFHRVIKDFMIQGGDPLSKDDDWSNDGTGGPGYKFADEFNDHKLVRGSLAMANSGPNTNGSQFFIVTAKSTPWLDGRHTNFGYVISGMDTVDKIENLPVNKNDHPTEDAVIESIELINKEDIKSNPEVKGVSESDILSDKEQETKSPGVKTSFTIEQ